MVKNEIKPINIKGPIYNNFYYLYDVLKVLENFNLVKFELIDSDIFYIEDILMWPGDRISPRLIKKYKNKQIILSNSIIGHNGFHQWVYFPDKYNSYLLYRLTEKCNRRINCIIWCGSNNRKRRQNYQLTNFCDCKINTRYERIDYKDYIKMLNMFKYCLCLPGFGPKCHREIEAIGCGCVPVLSPGVCTKYHNSLIEDVHYVKVEYEEDFKKIKNIPHNKWQEMSNNCLEWFKQNISPLGIYNVTKEVINKIKNI